MRTPSHLFFPFPRSHSYHFFRVHVLSTLRILMPYDPASWVYSSCPHESVRCVSKQKIISQLNPSLPSVDLGFRSVYRRETITIRRVGVRCNGYEDDTLMMNDHPVFPPHFLETSICPPRLISNSIIAFRARSKNGPVHSPSGSTISLTSAFKSKRNVRQWVYLTRRHSFSSGFLVSGRRAFETPLYHLHGPV